MAEEIQFSPVRVTGSSQEAAIEQALAMTGASREQIAFEILDESPKGITLRVRPLSDADNSNTEYSGAPKMTAERPLEVEELDVDEIVEDDLDLEGVEADDIGAQDVEELEVLDDEELENEEFEDESVSVAYDDDETIDDEAIEGEDSDELEIDAPIIEGDDDLEIEEIEDDEVPPEFDEEVVAAAQERVQALAADMLERMDLDVESRAVPLPQWMIDPDAVSDVPRVFLQIEGEDVSILIGKRGNTLQSFQYLLNLTLNNRVGEEGGEDGVHVVVDAGEYRARRASALQQSALEAAERAKRERRAVRMEPLGGHERRLVHLALRGDSEVATSSEGREPWRRVVVTPSNARGGRSEGGRSDEGHSGSGRSDNGYGDRGGRGGSGRGGSGRSGSGNSGNSGSSRGRGGYGGSAGGGYGNSGSSGGGRGEGRRYGGGNR